jgi:CBS domain-containing protein
MFRSRRHPVTRWKTARHCRRLPLRIADVMRPEPVTLAPGATFPQIVDTMLEYDRSVLPVVDPVGRLLGVVGDADLIPTEVYVPGRASADRSGALLAADLMVRHVDTASPEEPATEVAERMLRTHRHYLPVVRDGQLIGMVTRADLLRPFARDDEAILRDVEALLADPRRVPYPHQVAATVRDAVVQLSGSTSHPSDIGVVRAAVLTVPGVVDVDCALRARFPEPDPRGVPVQPLQWV